MTPTDEQLSEVERIFEADISYGEIEVERRPNGFMVSRMYEYVPFTYEILKSLVDLFGTTNISTDKDFRNGCSTCDYGSSYEVTFTLNDKQSERTEW